MTPEQARAIAKEAYVYGFPMVDDYRIMYSYFVDRDDPEYKGDWNQIHNTARVYTPADTAIQTPNSDTPYSMVGTDLRAEPLVLVVPPVESGRYYSLQFIDLYTQNFDYVGSRATGNGGGTYLLAGPQWNGAVPDGIDGVLRCDTELALVLYRTQLFGPTDLDGVTAVQAGYRVTTLSDHLDEPAPAPAPPIDFPAPLRPEEQRTSLRFFELLSFALGFAPVLPNESAMRDRFAAIGIGPDGTFRADALAPEVRAAIEGGMADAWAEFAAFKEADVDTGRIGAADLFGTKEYLSGNYLYRMAGAVLGIYGNSKDEAIYPGTAFDTEDKPLDGAHAYAYRFAPGLLPPVNAFWSLTMYQLPQSSLVANPIDRYLINSPMLPDLVRDPDGGITLLLQRDSPGAEGTANWLPAPEGPFQVILRLYWPEPAALDGSWQAPRPQRV